jgi:hypothetical protein
MFSALKLYFDITLARRGPEDLPVSTTLLGATTALYVALFAVLVTVLGAPQGNWVGQLLVSVTFTLLWIRGLLVLFGRPERFLQTASASFGISLITLPIAVPLQLQVMRLMEQALKLPPGAPMPSSTSIMVLAMPVLLWLFYVQAQVLRSALEIKLFQAVLLIIAQAVFESMLLTMLFAATTPAAS